MGQETGTHDWAGMNAGDFYNLPYDQRELIYNEYLRQNPDATNYLQQDLSDRSQASYSSALHTMGSPYVAFYKPHLGSSYVGVLPNGEKQIISLENAKRLGIVPKTDYGEFGPYPPMPDTNDGRIPRPGSGTTQPGLEVPIYTGPIDDPRTQADPIAGNPWQPPTPAPRPTGPGGSGGYLPDDPWATPPPMPPRDGGDPSDPSSWPPHQFVNWAEGNYNRDMYENQLRALTDQQNNYHQDALEAAFRREWAAENPQDNTSLIDWSDYDLPVREVQGEPTYKLHNDFYNAGAITPGSTTNRQIIQARFNSLIDPAKMQDYQNATGNIYFDFNNPNYDPGYHEQFMSTPEQAYWGNVLATSGGNEDMNWAYATSPQQLINQIGFAGEEGSRYKDYYKNLFRNMFRETTEKVGTGNIDVPAGYVSPV